MRSVISSKKSIPVVNNDSECSILLIVKFVHRCIWQLSMVKISIKFIERQWAIPPRRPGRRWSEWETLIKRPKKPGASESLHDGRESPCAITFNGLVQEPICVLASVWAKILRHCIFCAQSASAYFTVPFVTSYTECNFAKPFTHILNTRAYWNQLSVSRVQ